MRTRSRRERDARLELNRALKAYEDEKEKWRDSDEYDYFAYPPESFRKAGIRKENAVGVYRATHKAVLVWLNNTPKPSRRITVGKSVTKARLNVALAKACARICAKEGKNFNPKHIRMSKWQYLAPPYDRTK